MVAEVQALHSEQEEIDRMKQILEAQRAAFREHPYPSAAERIEHLGRIKPQLLRNLPRIEQALQADFGSRSPDETKLAEIMTTLEGIKYYSKHLRRWMKPQKRHAGQVNFPGSAMVVYQPVGVVGVMVPWNYPFYLALGPMIGALAAGNRVMIKMSEFTPESAELLRELLGEIFDENRVAVVTGEMEVSAAFSKQPFDHLLFTGSTAVGRHVMRAAADNLTPVTLELGGKSPAIISPDFPMKDAVERIAFGKCINAGQTCVAPDYVLCPRSRVDEFASAFRQQVARMYPTMVDNPDLTSVINERQYRRLQGYLDDARQKGASIEEINPAGEDFSATRKMPFTVLRDVTDEMQIMQEEIFGPLLAIVPYDSLDEALDYVNDRPRPLALYYFDWDNGRCEHVLRYTHSGGVCLNDAMTHVGVDDIPFGGTGESGMGQYHGHEGFLTFSKAKGVYRKGRLNPTRNILPPFGRSVHNFIYKHLMK